MAKVWLCLTLLMLLPILTEVKADPPQDVTITRMSVMAELFENSSVKVTIVAEIKVPSNFTSNIKAVMFPIVPIGIHMENPSKEVSSYTSLSADVRVQKISTQSFSDVIVTSFNDGLRPGSARNFSFAFMLTPNTSLAKFDESYRFAYRFYKPNVTLDYNKSVMEVILPRGAGVTKISQDGALSMDPLSERLVAVWSPFPSPRGGGWDFILEFKMISRISEQSSVLSQPKQATSMDSMILLLISNTITSVVTAAAVTLYGRIKFSRIRAPLFPASEEVPVSEEILSRIAEELEKLDRDEMSIIKIIHKNSGRIEQKDLPELTGFSKSKVSRILKRLDSMNFVRRVSQGKTKVIELNPLITKVLGES